MAKKAKKGWTGGGTAHLPQIDESNYRLIEKILKIPKEDPQVRAEIQGIGLAYSTWKDYFAKKPRLGEIKDRLKEVRDKAKALLEALNALDTNTSEKLASIYSKSGTNGRTKTKGRILLDRKEMNELASAYPNGDVSEEDDQRIKALFLSDKKISQRKFNVKHMEQPLFDSEDIKTNIKKIFDAAEESIEYINPDRGGRPRLYGLKDCISSIADIFERVNGGKATISKNVMKARPYSGPFFNLVWITLKSIDPKAKFRNESLGQHVEKTLRLRRKACLKIQ